MPAQHLHSARQAVHVAAPAAFVYHLLADARRWPLLMPRYLHVEQVDFDGVEERLSVWEMTSDRVRSTRVDRVLDPHTWSVDFEQHKVGGPAATVAGRWTVESLGPESSVLTLHQERRGPHPLETGPVARLDSVRRAAERWEELNELLFSLEERVHVPGPVELVHKFLHRVEDWPELLAHVLRAEVAERRPGVQLTTVDTATGPLGPRPVTTSAVRLFFPHAGRIVDKDLRAPAPIAARTGEWSLEPDQDGVTVTASHQVLLRPQADHAAPARLRHQVREWLVATTAEVLAAAGRYAGSAVRRP